jgi:hypothetical protein
MYVCSTSNNLILNKIDTKVTKVIGSQTVNGLSIAYKTVKFFPQNLEKFFKNLTLLDLHSSHLTEVHSHDLEPLTQLQALMLSNNSIHVIERDTFKHNIYLEVLWLNENGIKFVDPFVFDHLMNLRSLNMHGSVCGLTYARSLIQVHAVIMELREIFSFPSVLWTDNQELTTDLHRNKILLEISAALNVLLIVVLLAILVAVLIRKICRNNRVGNDSRNDSKTSFLFELPNIRERLQSVNFN